MTSTTRIVLGCLFLVSMPLSALADSVPVSEWQARKGDRFVVDTASNMGYLVHEDGDYAVTYVATGQQRVVHYIGKTYNAATPTGRWVVKAVNKWTSGKNRAFLRLYWDGNQYTSYGIHSNAGIDQMLAKGAADRYLSYGCVLVSDAILGKLEEAYRLNGNALEVTTTTGVNEDTFGG